MNIIHEFAGHFCPYNVWTERSPFHIAKSRIDTRLRFMPGVWDRTINDPSQEVLLLQDLEADKVIARRSDGTLVIEPGVDSPVAHVKLVDSPFNRTIKFKLEAGFAKGWSFRPSFWARTTSYREGETVFRTFHDAKLLAVAIVVNKQPRIRASTLPKFLYGAKELASV